MNIKLLKSKGTKKCFVNFIEHTDCGEKSLGKGELWEYTTKKMELSFWVIFKTKIYYASLMAENSYSIKRTAKFPQHAYTADVLN